MLGRPKVFSAPHISGPLASGGSNACNPFGSDCTISCFSCTDYQGSCIDTSHQHCGLGHVVVNVALVAGVAA